MVGGIFPQSFSTSPQELSQWQAANPILARLAELFGFDHIYTTPWFAIVLAFFVSSLSVSTVEQARSACAKTTALGRLFPDHACFVKRAAPELLAAARSGGYQQASLQGNTYRLIKNPLGYWGGTLFHLGLVVVICAVLFLVLTQKRGVVSLAEGEVFTPGMPWSAQERGMLAGYFFLAQAVRLDSLQPEFWETDDIRQQRSVVTFLGPGNQEITYTLEINRTVYHHGIRIDQSSAFGRTFFVILTDEAGKRFPVRMDLEHPLRRDQASYKSFEFDGVPFLLKTKYYADAEKRGIESDTPLLTIRLDQFGEVKGEVSLTPGQAGRLGPYTADLVKTTRWTGLVFSDIKGMTMVFLGFFVIILGGLLTYCTPPREILLVEEEEGCVLQWRAGRFAHFYESELLDIINNE